MQTPSSSLCPANIMLYASDADGIHKRSVQPGAILLAAPTNQFCGDSIGSDLRSVGESVDDSHACGGCI